MIRNLESSGPECEQLNTLRQAAEDSRDAIMKGDFRSLGAAMQKNTDAQARLHPDLVSIDALRIIDVAKKHRALGWKVNGAGGGGGSLTLLSTGSDSDKLDMIHHIEDVDPKFKNIPMRIDPEGMRVWDSRG